MDKLLQQFKEKINNIDEPDFSDNDWSNFVNYRTTFFIKPVKFINILGKSVAAIASAVVIMNFFVLAELISPKIQADFVSEKPKLQNIDSDSDQIDINGTNQKNNQTTSSYSSSASNSIITNSRLNNNDLIIEYKHNSNTSGNVNTESFSKTKNKKYPDENIVNAVNVKALLIKTGKKSGFFNNYQNIKNTNIQNQILTNNNTPNTDQNPHVAKNEQLNKYDLIDCKLNDNNTFGQKENRSLDLVSLSNKKLYLQKQKINDTTFFKLSPTSSSKVFKSGFVGFDIAWNNTYSEIDKLDIKKFSGFNIGGHFKIFKNFKLSGYYGVISGKTILKNIEKYSFLNIIPHLHPDESIEEVHVYSKSERYGMSADYTILKFKYLYASIGLGFEHEQDSNFDFNIEIYDKFDTRNIYRQNVPVYDHTRNFIFPQVKVAYPLDERLCLAAEAVYKFSLVTDKEKYLTMNLGLIYNF